jgi:hypothetical protein
MFVNRIVEDDWSGVRSGETECECNSIEQVIAAIKRLNGRNKTSVYLHGDGQRSLTVSGGNDGRYVAFVTIGVDDEFYNLIDPTRPDSEMLDVVTGGERGKYPASQCVALDAAVNAVRQFALDGSMSRSLTWQKQR